MKQSHEGDLLNCICFCFHIPLLEISDLDNLQYLKTLRGWRENEKAFLMRLGFAFGCKMKYFNIWKICILHFPSDQ